MGWFEHRYRLSWSPHHMVSLLLICTSGHGKVRPKRSSFKSIFLWNIFEINSHSKRRLTWVSSSKFQKCHVCTWSRAPYAHFEEWHQFPCLFSHFLSPRTEITFQFWKVIVLISTTTVVTFNQSWNFVYIFQSPSNWDGFWNQKLKTKSRLSLPVKRFEIARPDFICT